MPRAVVRRTCLLIAMVLCAANPPLNAAYDPSHVAAAAPITHELLVLDADRQREVPLRVVLPPGMGLAPVVLFSHGLGGSREGSAYLGRHWAGRGYAVVYVQHPGSDDSIWKDTPRQQRRAAMNQAASARNYFLRVRDVPAVLDQLEQWSTAEGHPLRGRLDLDRIGMSGHSFGAVTTQAVSGRGGVMPPSPIGGSRRRSPSVRTAHGAAVTRSRPSARWRSHGS